LAILTQYNDAFANSKPLSKNAMEIYVDALSDIPAEVVAGAMKKIALTARFFPTVAEIRDVAESLVRHGNGTTLPTPDEAWEEAFRLAKSYPVADEWPFSCQEIRDAVKQFGGKLAFYDIQAGGESVARAQFQRTYNSVISRSRENRINNAVLGADEIKKRLGEAYKKLIG